MLNAKEKLLDLRANIAGSKATIVSVWARDILCYRGSQRYAAGVCR